MLLMSASSFFLESNLANWRPLLDTRHRSYQRSASADIDAQSSAHLDLMIHIHQWQFIFIKRG
jgi:hypothetical protein